MYNSTIEKLQNWFSARTDGDWEHQGGISIGTTDNPGWNITVEFDGLVHQFGSAEVQDGFMRSDSDYALFSYDQEQDTLLIACGISNLDEALQIFLDRESSDNNSP